MPPSSPDQHRERLQRAVIPALFAALLVLFIALAGTGKGLAAPGGLHASDQGATAPALRSGHPSAASPVLPARAHGVLPAPAADGEDMAQGLSPVSTAIAGGCPCDRSSRPDAPRAALRWRHRGGAPPLHA